MIALKGRFKTTNDQLFGLLLINFNENGGFIDSAHVIVTKDASTFAINPATTSWRDFQTAIQNMKLKGRIVQSITNDLQSTLKSVYSEEDFYEEVFNQLKANNHEKIQFILRNLLYRYLAEKDSQVQFETGSDQFDNAELTEYEKSSQSEESGGGEKSAKTDGVNLALRLLLSPVRGKPIMDLKVGEKIMVKIDPDAPRGNYFIDLLKLREGTEVLPVPGEVINVKDKEGLIQVRVRLGDGIYGASEEEPQVKVRLYNPATDDIRKSLKIEKEPEENQPSTGLTTGDLKEKAGALADGAWVNFLVLGLIFVLAVMIYILLATS